MGDKYEVLNAHQNDATAAIPHASLSGSPAADVTPLLDPEAELLKSTTDLCTKKFESEKEQVKGMPRKLMIMIYVGAMILSIISFNIGITIGYYAL
ncbi:unnamed protein product [Cercopithifilaria johnstoni]|uniref:Uncharacterized protein n=1 Tax=Cercopithifilaria johnstoni TaxID=2874296 RepID=A0A8J2Q812_9BILA|nr:unnamed protein product [Cercopithifilaria johnstoni]